MVGGWRGSIGGHRGNLRGSCGTTPIVVRYQRAVPLTASNLVLAGVQDGAPHIHMPGARRRRRLGWRAGEYGWYGGAFRAPQPRPPADLFRVRLALPAACARGDKHHQCYWWQPMHTTTIHTTIQPAPPFPLAPHVRPVCAAHRWLRRMPEFQNSRGSNRFRAALGPLPAQAVAWAGCMDLQKLQHSLQYGRRRRPAGLT
jgi:hypothetical protein